jgi:hypothetical protein
MERKADGNEERRFHYRHVLWGGDKAGDYDIETSYQDRTSRRSHAYQQDIATTDTRIDFRSGRTYTERFKETALSSKLEGEYYE